MKKTLLPRENVFGHTKKLTIFIDSIKKFQKNNSHEKLDVLDFGCGNGSAVTQYLAQLGHNVTGIDLHGPSIKYAEQYFGSTTCKFIEGNTNTLIKLNKKFDVIIFSDLLEHVEHPQNLLMEAKNLLKAGGHILVTIPNGRGPFEIESYISRIPFIGKTSIKCIDLFIAILNKYIFKDVWSKVISSIEIPYNHTSGHIQFFTKKSFLAICNDAGLTLNKMQKISFLSGPYTNSFFAPWKRFCKINTQIAEVLPHWLASAWFFELAAK